MEPFNRKELLSLFTREFVTQGQNLLDTVLTNSLRAEELAKKLFGNLTLDLNPLHNHVILECLENVEINNNLNIPLDETVKTGISLVYKKEVQKLLVKSALEIFNSFEPQLQFVCKKSGQDNVERSRAVEILGQFSGRVCVRKLVDMQSTKCLHSAILFDEDERKIKEESLLQTVLPTYEETIEDNLVFKWDDREKVVSKTKFFQWPLMAVIPKMEDELDEDKREIFVRNKDLQRFIDKQSQKEILRKPMDFEWREVEKWKNSGELHKISINPDPSIKFEWQDSTKVMDDLITNLQLDIQSTDQLYKKIGQLIILTNDKLITTLQLLLAQHTNKIGTDFQLDSSRRQDIASLISAELSKIIEALKESGSETLESGIIIKSKGIRFNVKEPISSFTGRTQFLDDLHLQFQHPDLNSNLDPTTPPTDCPSDFALPFLRVITGLGGIGKSGVARKYIKLYGHHYHHIIWIDAETTESMIQNFRTIAEQNLKIPTKNVQTDGRWRLWDEQKNSKILLNEIWPTSLNPNLPAPVLSKTSDTNWRPMEQVMEEIYEIICQHPSLFIFENAETFLDNEIGTSSGIAPFLPPKLSSKLIKPKILVTSGNPIWNSIPSKLIPLDPLSLPESVTFLLTTLQLQQVDEAVPLIHDLSDLTDRFPLLLQLATTCIFKFAEQKSLDTLTSVRQYIRDYNEGLESPEFFRYFQKSSRSLSVYLTLLLTFDKVEKIENGPMCLKILKYSAFLYPTEIPREILHAFFPGKDIQVEEALLILQQFALIKSSPTAIRVHRQIQEVTLEKMREDGESEPFLKKMMKDLTHFITSMTPLTLSSRDLYRVTLINVLRLIPHIWDRLSIVPKIRKFVHFIADRILDISMHSKALQLYTALYDLSLHSAGPIDPYTLELEFKLGQCHLLLADHKKALDTLNSVYDSQRRILGDDDLSVLKTLCEIAKLKSSTEDGTHDDLSTLRLLDECYEQQKKILPQYHPSALQILHRKAVVLHSLCKFEDSLQLFNLILEKQAAIYGVNSFQVLNTQNDLAIMLRSKGDHAEAEALLQNVLQKRMDIIGVDHPHVFATLWQILRIFEDQGKYDKALEVGRDLWQAKKELFGETDRRVLAAEEDIAWLLCRQKNYKQSSILCEKILERQRHLLGENHIDVLTTLYNMGTIEFLQNNYLQAFNLYQLVHGKLSDLIGQQKSKTMVTMLAMGRALGGLRRYEQALDIFLECWDERGQVLGENHPETILVYWEMVELYESQKKFAHALTLLHKIYKLQIEGLGVDKLDSLMTAVKIGRIYLELDKNEDAFEFLGLLQKNLQKLAENNLQGSEINGEAEVGLGIILIGSRKYDEAVEIFGKVLEGGKDKRSGGFDRKGLNDQMLLFVVYKAQQNYGKSMGIAQDVYKKMVEIVGESHPDTLFIGNKIAGLYQTREEYDRAFEWYRKVWEGMDLLFGPDHPIVLEAEESMGNNLEKLDRYEEALKVYDQLYEKRKGKLGQGHPDVLQIQFLKAIVYVSQKKFDVAQGVLQQVYQIQVDKLGKGHPDPVSTKEKIDAIQEYLEDKKKGCGCSVV